MEVWAINNEYDDYVDYELYSTFEKAQKAFEDALGVVTLKTAIEYCKAQDCRLELFKSNWADCNVEDYSLNTLVYELGRYKYISIGDVYEYVIFDEESITDNFEYQGWTIKKRTVH